MASNTQILRAVLDGRLSRFPRSPFFTFANRELNLIEERWRASARFDRSFYDALDIGLMCARELEQSDPEFCDAVYAMLEEIRSLIED